MYKCFYCIFSLNELECTHQEQYDMVKHDSNIELKNLQKKFIADTVSVCVVYPSKFKGMLLVSVTNKEICLVRIVSYLCKVLCHLFARLLIEKKDLFSPRLICCKYAFITPQSLFQHTKILD